MLLTEAFQDQENASQLSGLPIICASCVSGPWGMGGRPGLERAGGFLLSLGRRGGMVWVAPGQHGGCGCVGHRNEGRDEGRRAHR